MNVFQLNKIIANIIGDEEKFKHLINEYGEDCTLAEYLKHLEWQEKKFVALRDKEMGKKEYVFTIELGNYRPEKTKAVYAMSVEEAKRIIAKKYPNAEKITLKA